MRPVRDILAECMRREVRDFIFPLWEDWTAYDSASAEQVRQRADKLIRLLRSYGVELVVTGEKTPRPPEPGSDVIYRWFVDGSEGKVERVVKRIAGDRERWSVQLVEGRNAVVEAEFSMEEAHRNAGMVLTNAPEAAKIKGLGRQLAAAVEIYRQSAAT